MFLLPAWSHLGVDRVRLVAVARRPADTIRSIEKRDHIRQDRAEAIVDAYLNRLAEIADTARLTVIRFPGNGDSLIHQVRDLAASLDLPWDEEAARSFFDEKLVRHRSRLRDTSPTYDSLIQRARRSKKVPAISLRALKLRSEPEIPLEKHVGALYAHQRNQIWDMAHFSTDPEPSVVEILLEGGRPGGANRPGVDLQQVKTPGPLAVAAVLMKNGLRPHGVVAPGLVAGRPRAEIEYLMRSLYLTTDAFAEVLLDVPDPQGEGLLTSTPPPVDRPLPPEVEEIALGTGWDHVVTQRLSPGRSGMMFRKRILTDTELVPVVTDVLASLERIHAMEARLSSIVFAPEPSEEPLTAVLEAERRRAEEAERALDRLRNRRSVRFALALSQLFRPVFRAVRSWKNARSSGS